MTRTSLRMIAAVATPSVVLRACGNSNGDGSSAPAKSAKAAAPGVGGKKNRNVKKLDCYVDGIKAYFAYRNSQGGIYGRRLLLNDPVDDQLGNNQARALAMTGWINATLANEGLLAAGSEFDSAKVTAAPRDTPRLCWKGDPLKWGRPIETAFK